MLHGVKKSIQLEKIEENEEEKKNRKKFESLSKFLLEKKNKSIYFLLNFFLFYL